MEIKNIIRTVQVSAVLLIFIGAVIGFSIEVFNMISIKKSRTCRFTITFYLC